MALRGFKSGALKRFYADDDARRLPQGRLKRIARILDVLNKHPFEFLASPTYRMHRLKGNRKGEWSVRVSGNLRITFRVENGDAYDVD